ncbi:MAG: HEAT repeat domain-containing protein [Blastocatellia bacterium]|nr:HEAT repeat domain-containing protein [Blastocatellia bacterium]
MVTKSSENRINTFNELSKQLKKGNVAIRISALKKLVELNHPNTTSEITMYLRDKSPKVREVAAESLGEIGNTESADFLLKSTSDSYYGVRMMAVRSLGYILIGRDCPHVLIDMLNDPDELVRIEACEALESIGDKKVINALWEKIHKDESFLVKRYAAIALGNLGDKEEIKKLRAITKTEKSVSVRVGLYYALYKLGETDVLSNLVDLLKNKDYRTRCAVSNALAEICKSPPDSKVAYQALQEALRNERTIAAKSTIESCIKRLLVLTQES